MVLPVDGATTVITRVAEPVLYGSGRPAAAAVVLGGGGGAGWLVVGLVVRGGGAVWVRFGLVGAAIVGALNVVFGVVLGGVLTGALLDAAGSEALEVQPARINSDARGSTNRRKSTNTRSGCHATPIRIRGWAAGVSHRMIDASVLCGTATQPAVARPSVTCRKNALPAPCRTPVGELRVL